MLSALIVFALAGTLGVGGPAPVRDDVLLAEAGNPPLARDQILLAAAGSPLVPGAAEGAAPATEAAPLELPPALEEKLPTIGEPESDEGKERAGEEITEEARPTKPRHLKLWPLFEYHSDGSARTRQLKMLGPLLEYHSNPDTRSIFLRPFLSIRQARVGHDDEVRVLYPLLRSRWTADEQTTTGLGGLFSYRTTIAGDNRALTSQRLRVLPIYFYDWRPDIGNEASLAPFYTDVEDVFGYERVEMALFPAYLRLHEPGVVRRYTPFPFFGVSQGPSASGRRLWPLYGWESIGGNDESARDESGFVAWPFYVWQTRAVDGGTERRTVSFPFYARLDGPTRESTAYGGILYAHAIDRQAGRESFAFPWPLGLYQKDTGTGDGTILRVLPLYQLRRAAAVPPPFFLWPLDLEPTPVDRDENRRGDALLALYRYEETAGRPAEASATTGDGAPEGTEAGPTSYLQTHAATAPTSYLQTLWPLYREEWNADTADGNVAALIDALAPRDAGYQELYAPLYEVYAWSAPAPSSRWSIAWGAVTRADGVTTYPWAWDLD